MGKIIYSGSQSVIQSKDKSNGRINSRWISKGMATSTNEIAIEDSDGK